MYKTDEKRIGDYLSQTNVFEIGKYKRIKNIRFGNYLLMVNILNNFWECLCDEDIFALQYCAIIACKLLMASLLCFLCH